MDPPRIAFPAVNFFELDLIILLRSNYQAHLALPGSRPSQGGVFSHSFDYIIDFTGKKIGPLPIDHS